MLSLICAWINGLVNNREAGDMRRHGAHYDVILMSLMLSHGLQSVASQACVVQMHWTNIIHPRKPSFVITPAAFVDIANRYLYICSNEIHHISLKQLHLIILVIEAVKLSWFHLCTWRNRVMFERRPRPHSRALAIRFFVCGHWWRRQWEWLRRVHYPDWEWHLCMGCSLQFTCYLSYFYHFIFHAIKGVKNGCPCIVQTIGT